MIQLDIKKPPKPAVIEVRQHSYILEIKFLIYIIIYLLYIYISTSLPHSQLHRLMRLEKHTSCADISPLLILFPLGTKHNYSIVPHSTVYHILHISAEEKTQCCVRGIWHHDKYALEEEGKGWRREGHCQGTN